MRERKLTWRLADIWTFFKNSFMAVLKSEFLMRANAGRYFIHILYTFLLFGLVIWISLMIEITMSKVEKNKEILKELEIEHTQKTFEVVSLTRRSTVGKSLERLQSNVKEPEKPAYRIKKK